MRHPPEPQFRRARRPEQQDQRRHAILAAAEAMLAEVPLEDVGLRELSRRLAIPKSNVVRYFGTREGVLLELLHRSLASWLDQLDRELGAGPCGIERLVETWARTLAAHPLLCRLWSQLATVLERNVSADSVHRFKLADLEHRRRLARMIHRCVPELDEEASLYVTRIAVVAVAGLWPFCTPTPTVVEATTDPRLADARLDFAAMYADILRITITGLLALPRDTAAG
ncbi:TetR family transcriptional regulator [Pseudonocardia xinjiangensis]